jgi:hypothetical protein
MLEKLILSILSNSIYINIENTQICTCGKNIIINDNKHSNLYTKCLCGKFLWFFKNPGTYPIYTIFKTIYKDNILKILKCTFIAYFDGEKICKNTIVKKLTTLNLTSNKKSTKNEIKSFFKGITIYDIKFLLNDLEKQCDKYNIKPNYGSLIKLVRITEVSNFYLFIYLAINYYAFEAFIKLGFQKVLEKPEVFLKSLNKSLPNPNSKKISEITGISPKILNLIKSRVESMEDISNTNLFLKKFGNNKFIELLSSEIFYFKYLKSIIYILSNGYKFKEFLVYITSLKDVYICSKSAHPVYCIDDLCNYNCKKNVKTKEDINYWLKIIVNTIDLSKKLNLQISKYNKYILNEYNLLQQIRNNYVDNVDESDSKLLEYYNKNVSKITQVDNKFLLTCPKSIKDFKLEEYNMKNCISTYIENVIKNQSTILFLRTFDQKCYMTLELNNNNELIQAKKKLNMMPNKNDLEYLSKLCKINNWIFKLR